MIDYLLRHPGQLEHVSRTGAAYMKADYAARVSECWRSILDEALDL
jgi:hypothetical protein